MTRQPSKVGRPNIPEAVKNELWARTAGRCEFRGCNQVLYADALAQTRSNLGIISHIVAFSPDGPRGDAIRSPLLSRDISNLLLTCRDHGKVVDDSAQVSTYPEALLLEFKGEHEHRIRLVAEVQEDAQTYLVFFQASIESRRVEIDRKDAALAVRPKYPADEDPWVFDFSNVPLPGDPKAAFEVLAKCTGETAKELLRCLDVRRQARGLSVFALAPVALLIQLGYSLGGIERVEAFQKHRSPEGWSWPAVENVGEWFQTAYNPARGGTSEAEVALLLSVSAKVDRSEVFKLLGDNVHLYELTAPTPGADYLRSRARLQSFGEAFRALLNTIRDSHGCERPLHLFAAVPAPVAIEVGRSIQRFHPSICLYEYVRPGEQLCVLTIDASRTDSPG